MVWTGWKCRQLPAQRNPFIHAFFALEQNRAPTLVNHARAWDATKWSNDAFTPFGKKHVPLNQFQNKKKKSRFIIIRIIVIIRNNTVSLSLSVFINGNVSLARYHTID